ncbi:hypothetical protein [Dyadobacter sp. NIV53]|uniref:hypothetical protein n=1 Tax=Dyadobacter sp. NIV53 TaxID=2861765 RepID=UPI001C88AEF4|nr:hypothetical protein [Dyadobacter sp. NIV53]
MTYKPTTQQMSFVLPLYFTKAEVVFTKGSGSLENISFQILEKTEPRHVVSTEKLEKGFWLAQLVWSMGRSQYCTEKLIEIA